MNWSTQIDEAAIKLTVNDVGVVDVGVCVVTAGCCLCCVVDVFFHVPAVVLIKNSKHQTPVFVWPHLHATDQTERLR